MSKLTLGQRAADFAAARIGSWTFLISFNCIMLAWIAANIHFGKDAFDPFPFILLNLCLSWLAGVQAPLIMISQNRQEQIMKETVDDIRVLANATHNIALATKDLLEIHNKQLEDLLEDVEELKED
ncbi:MAG TPA: DUF1003 domain-containing protein [Methanosarcina sp.]|nr:DUF1003 domain-containing protein [Methanosarcina sp.]